MSNSFAVGGSRLDGLNQNGRQPSGGRVKADVIRRTTEVKSAKYVHGSATSSCTGDPSGIAPPTPIMSTSPIRTEPMISMTRADRSAFLRGPTKITYATRSVAASWATSAKYSVTIRHLLANPRGMAAIRGIR